MRIINNRRGGGSARAKTFTASVPLTTGLLTTVSSFGLLAPVTFAKTGGNANLTLASNGQISAAAALTSGATQSLTGTATGSDGVVFPFTANLTGAVSVPAAPTVTLAAGNGQISIAWVDGSNGGAAITAHTIYVNGAAMLPISSASPYVLTGLANGVAVNIEVSAINSAGEGAKSAVQSATPVSVPVFVPYAAEYFDTFDTAGELNGSTNWVAEGGNAKFVKDSGYVRVVNQFQAASNALFGPVSGFPENLYAKFTYNTGTATWSGGTENSGTWDANRQSLRLWYVDSSNYLSLNIDKANGRLSIARVIAGSATSFNTNNGSLTFTNTSTIEVFTSGGFLRVKLDGKWAFLMNRFAYPYDRLDMTAVSAANRVGRVGFNGSTYRWPILYDVSVSTLYFEVGDHSNFFARDSKTASGVTNKTISGTYVTKTPTALMYRVLDYNTQAVIQTWAPMTNQSWSAGSWSGGVSAPTGGPYTFQCAMVDTDGKWHTYDSKPVLVGALYAYDGQSNSVNRNVGGAAGTRNDLAATSVNFASVLQGSPAFTVLTNYNVGATGSLSAVTFAANVAATKLGIPVGIMVTGVGGASLSALDVNSANWSRVPTLINTFGKPEGVIWDQGEGDADGASDPTWYTTTFLNNIVAPWRAAVGNPSLPFLLVDVGRFASTTAPNAGNAAQIDRQRETVRQAKRAICAADPLIKMSASHLGQDHGTDAYHYTGAGYAIACTNDGYSIAKEFAGVSTPDGRGPIATGAVLSGDRTQITLSFDMNGAASLTDLVTSATGTVPTPSLSGALYGYQVSINDFTSLLPISTMVRSGNTLVITLASAAPAGTVKVRSFYGWSYDDTNLFYGTGYADGRANIPVHPIATPLVAA